MYYTAFHIPEVGDTGTESTTEFLQMNCVGYYGHENMKHERYRKNGRRDYLLIYHHKGKALTRVNGEENDIKDGTVIIYHPGEEQLYRLGDEEPSESYWIHFTGYGVKDTLSNLGLVNDHIFYTGQMKEYAYLSRMARNEIQSRRIGFELNIASYLIQILCLISRSCSRARYTKAQIERNDKFELSVGYLHANYEKPITVPELADVAGLCVSRYIHLFKQQLGSTPKDYLIRFRINRAKELLRDTQLTIRQISLIVGFEDQLYFSRVYKKLEGKSPKEDRV